MLIVVSMNVIHVASIVPHGLIQRDRILTGSDLLPEKPGELVRVAKTNAGAQDNDKKLEHKHQILEALENNGFRPKLVTTKLD